MAMVKGLFVPTVPKDGILTIIALVGTTVVPYNLFLHASLVSEKWKSVEDLSAVKRDTYISIALGGLVSMAIIIAATTIQGGEVKNVMDLAKGLQPLYGDAAKYFMGIGLFAAGVTSAITAPLAAAYAAGGILGWNKDLKSIKFRMVWGFILLMGIIFSSLGIKPIEIIKIAQVANGFLLPLIAGFLLWIVNQKGLMNEHINKTWQNIFGIGVVLLTLALGMKSIITLF